MATNQQYLVKSYKGSCAVRIVISTPQQGTPVYIVGFDPLNPNTLYFRSRFNISGQEEITLNCPQSPIVLNVLVWSGNDLPYKVESIKMLPLSINQSNDPVTKFIESFSRQAGRLRIGVYGQKDVPFKIHYLRAIYTDDGRIHPTPARIHVDLPIIQVSKMKFNQMTIPERIIILLHETAHNFINSDQDDEVEADQHAIDIYKQLGYPKIEAVNAFGNIMGDTDNNYERMLNLINI